MQADGPVRDAFVTKIDTNRSGASSLCYSTYLGGNSSDMGQGIKVDGGGNIISDGGAAVTARGFYYLDTTLYANGVHTISWSVTDDAGNTDGIGSRYFNVMNVNNPAATSTSAFSYGYRHHRFLTLSP